MINRTYYSKDHQGTSAYHVFAAQLVGFKNMSIFTVKQEKALDVVFTKTLGDKSVNLDFASEVNLEMLVFHPPEAQSNRENHLWVIKSFYIRLSILLNYLNLLWLVYFTKFPPPAPPPALHWLSFSLKNRCRHNLCMGLYGNLADFGVSRPKSHIANQDVRG